MLREHLHWFPVLVTTLDVGVSLVASGHVLLYKRDTRAAIGWIGLIWLSPILGTVLYVLLGINRVNRRARMLRRGQARPRARISDPPCTAAELDRVLGPDGSPFRSLARLGDGVSPWPIVSGNRVEPLVGGDETYPAMLHAIDEATRSITLATYIFDNDRAGKRFIDALGRAIERGVQVRVLIDDIGARHTWPSAIGPLRQARVPVARFNPTLTPIWLPYVNLRNHRKILVVDGRVGFTGGMNILEEYWHSLRPARPNNDLHFRIDGPVVAHLQQVFADDWAFATDELLEGELWFPPIAEVGDVLGRGVVDGPDDDRDNLLKVMLGALAEARSHVAIATPYFLPDSRLTSALEVAASRGVQVDILLPSRNNHILVEWACMAMLPEVVAGGSRVWFAEPPFDHAKLMLMDGTWTFLGSANLDPRSLRLNFELNVECYSPRLAEQLEPLFRERIARATRVTAGMLETRSLAIRLRDGAARLLSPYL
jgi:cardiolipin synthase